jgi:glycosyltransferase involved in cell wall biosynthesis
VALIPNGVSDEWFASQGDASRIREKLDLPLDRKVMLYLSRIHPVKGIPMLLEAVSRTEEFKRDWVLVIAGMEEEGHEGELVQLVQQLGLRECVRFVGPLFHHFAIAVAEALGAGIPVLTTKGAPWSQIVDEGCGWWVEPSPDGLEAGLERVLATDAAELVAMGARGRSWVSEEFTWDRVGQMCLGLYEWLLQRGPKPEFVQVHS